MKTSNSKQFTDNLFVLLIKHYIYDCNLSKVGLYCIYQQTRWAAWWHCDHLLLGMWNILNFKIKCFISCDQYIVDQFTQINILVPVCPKYLDDNLCRQMIQCTRYYMCSTIFRSYVKFIYNVKYSFDLIMAERFISVVK